jgi:hypothetical protein
MDDSSFRARGTERKYVRKVEERKRYGNSLLFLIS